MTSIKELFRAFFPEKYEQHQREKSWEYCGVTGKNYILIKNFQFDDFVSQFAEFFI